MYRLYDEEINRKGKDKEITVLGIGMEVVKTDMVILVFDIVNEHPDPLKTISENRKLVQAAKDYTKKFGIKDSDMLFSRKALEPVYNEDKEITSYKAVTRVKLLFYDMDSISEYLYNIKGRHVVIGDIRFTVNNPSEYYNIALDKAVQNVYDKAYNVAEKMGVMIDRVPKDIIEITKMQDVVQSLTYKKSKEQDVLTEGFFSIMAIVQGKFKIING